MRSYTRRSQRRRAKLKRSDAVSIGYRRGLLRTVVIADAGFLVEPAIDALAERLDAALGGARPSTPPAEYAKGYDWDAIAG